MRALLIILAVLGVVGYAIYSVLAYGKKQIEAPTKIAQATTANVVEPEGNQVNRKPNSVKASETIQAQTIGSFTFTKRIAPKVPEILGKVDTKDLAAELDVATNSWVWTGNKTAGAKLEALAGQFDKEQMELDLEFCLVVMNTNKLRDRGLSIFYDPRASWLNVLRLDGDNGSLRIAAKGFSIDLAYEDSNAAAKVISLPVIRCVDGAPWSFTTDTQIPIARSDITDGTIRQSVEYREVGFGLKGIVRVLPRDCVLEVEQRNGSVKTTSTGSSVEAPAFTSQTLDTTLKLAWWQWSVLGGINIDREETRKGIFRDKILKSADFLVIFVRPRLALTAPTSAVPVHQDKTAHPLLPDLEEIPSTPEQHESTFILEKFLERERSANGPPHK